MSMPYKYHIFIFTYYRLFGILSKNVLKHSHESAASFTLSDKKTSRKVRIKAPKVHKIGDGQLNTFYTQHLEHLFYPQKNFPMMEPFLKLQTYQICTKCSKGANEKSFFFDLFLIASTRN